MELTRIYLMRHGEVVNHHEYRYNGHFDVDITEAGVEQMERVAGFLEDRSISAVYSSDLTRAVRGADIIGARLGLEPEGLEELRELHLGRWEGLTREEAAQRYPEEAHFSFADLATGRLKGGESINDLKERVLPAIDGLIGRNAGRNIAVVAHGGVNRVVLCASMGLPTEKIFNIEQDYGCVNIIDCFSDGVRVVKLLNGGPNTDPGPTKRY